MTLWGRDGGSSDTSLRQRLLLGILLPVVLLIGFNSYSLYEQALDAADTAYDRTLLATAKSIGEQLQVSGEGPQAKLQASLLYSVLEPFEADNRSRLYYRVSGFQGEMVSGFEDFPPWRGQLPQQGPYAALVDFYDDEFRGEAVRVAVLLQPVSGPNGLGMATIQVAETLELRQALARQMLWQTLWRQGLLVLVIVAVVVWVVQRATLPVRRLSAQLQARAEGDLSPFDAPDAPREWRPLVEATNDLVARLHHLLEHQKRFVRDASHQLKTPLAVLKAQVQSALRGDVDHRQALLEINTTVDRAAQVAHQMLALAKVEQLRQQLDPAPRQDWDQVARDVALDLSALIAEAQLDFEIRTTPAPVLSHEWALRELTRNLLHNAVQHSPIGGQLRIEIGIRASQACLCIEDNGPGLADSQRRHLFMPFATGKPSSGSGLGLAICHGIVDSLGGEITLDNRWEGDRVIGLSASVFLPLAVESPTIPPADPPRSALASAPAQKGSDT